MSNDCSLAKQINLKWSLKINNKDGANNNNNDNNNNNNNNNNRMALSPLREISKF
jgi:hypothetical protein